MKLSQVILPLIQESVRAHKLELVNDGVSYCDFKDDKGNIINIILAGVNNYAVRVNKNEIQFQLKREDLNPIIITELNF
jgi:hypothetical protein